MNLDHPEKKQGKIEETPSVVVIVLSWNNKSLLQICLASLRQKTNYPYYHVVVVDNGSVDDSVSWIGTVFPWVEVVALDRNYGFSIGNNKGIAYALEKFNPEYVLLLNNDTEIIKSDWLSRMVAVAEIHEQVGILGCELVYADGRIQYIGTKLSEKGLTWLKPQNYPKLPALYDVDCVLGACFLIKRSVIDKIGGLDEGFSPFGHEESDFCLRARKAGYQIFMLSTVKVIHQNRASMKIVNLDFIRRVERQNVIRFMLLNFPVSWVVKRLPYESIMCPFVVRNKKGRFPIKLRSGQDMLMEVKTNLNVWIYTFHNFHEILEKRQNRKKRLPLQL